MKPLLAALATIGLHVFHDETDIVNGHSITGRVTEGLTGTRMLVAWYSKTYLTLLGCQEIGLFKTKSSSVEGIHRDFPLIGCILANPG